jgi:hypothetical protein
LTETAKTTRTPTIIRIWCIILLIYY